MRLRISMWILTLGLAALQPAWPQALSDPTKPPAGFQSVAQGPAGPARSGLVLQSVLISADSRSAIINGEHVMLGEKIGGVRLVRVAETEVVLLAGGAPRTLKLFPGVDKRPVGSSREAGTPGKAREAKSLTRMTPGQRRPR